MYRLTKSHRTESEIEMQTHAHENKTIEFSCNLIWQKSKLPHNGQTSPSAG